MVIGMDQNLIESQARLESYIASLSEVIGRADRARAAWGRLPRPSAAARPQERGASGRGCRSGSGFGQAPVSTALRGARAVVR